MLIIDGERWFVGPGGELFRDSSSERPLAPDMEALGGLLRTLGRLPDTKGQKDYGKGYSNA